ncbi:MAG TPA: P-II family nitrogen regulator [Vicinamibacterales bacterium]
MKLITAVLRPHALDAVHDALDPNEARVISAARVLDDHYSFGAYRGAELRQPRPRLRLEIVVLNDLAVPDVVNVIEQAAVEAGGGDAWVVVSPVDDIVRLPRALPPGRA